MSNQSRNDTFFRRYENGRALASEISDHIKEWHESTDENIAENLHDHLGMSWNEYSYWLSNPTRLHYILMARNKKMPVLNSSATELGIAARNCNERELLQLRDWLKNRKTI